MRNPKWAREELILALDLYFRCNPVHTSVSNPEVIELSRILNLLTIHQNKPDASKFRNPNGVYMKLCNFLRFDPGYTGSGLKAGGQQEESIWKEFASNQMRLRAEATKISLEAEHD